MKRFFESPAARLHFLQVSKFVIVGSLGACIDIGTVAFLTRTYHVHPLIAGTISTFLSVTAVYFLNRYFTFKAHEAVKGQLAKFVLVYGASIVLNIALYSAFVWLGLVPEIAKAVAIIIGAFWNYLFSHFFVFKKSA